MKKYGLVVLFFVIIFLGFYFFQKDEIVQAPVSVPTSPDAAIAIENEFDDKVVYTTDQAVAVEELQADCQARGGQFNTCGSVCASDAELCIDVCAFTCELGERGDETEDLSKPTEEARLTALPGFEGSGIATREFDGLAFVHTLTVFLPPAPTGSFYEGWLVQAGLETFISTGRLEAQGGGYGLVYTSQMDQSAYGKVVITLETAAQGLDGQPETHVLEGSF